jgi:hypothetical protein
MKFKFIVVIYLLISLSVKAHEGLWIPFLIEQQIFPAMQQAGCKLTAEQIYSAKQASLTNAIVKIGEGCSGGFLSENGLLITNYHCVEYFINTNSNLENNYIQKGFWAKTYSEELSSPGLTADVLVSIEDISNQIMALIPSGLSIDEAYKRKSKIIDSLQNIENAKSEYKISIESFYEGNQYFKFTYLRYQDIRLVGFPSVNTAQFGAEADNWAWPRQAADFALIRVYSDTLQMPKKYSKTNVPYVPKKILEIEPKGVKPGDFTMVLGFPAQTNNYCTSKELQLIHDSLNPRQIAMREIRIKPIEAYMKTSDSAYLQYYATYADLANYYKKWKGEQYGIEHTNALAVKMQQEAAIQNWIHQSEENTKKYGTVLDDYNNAYKDYVQQYTTIILYMDGLWRMDYIKHALQYVPILNLRDTSKMQKTLLLKMNFSKSYYNRINTDIEGKSLSDMLEYICNNVPDESLPASLRFKSDKERKALFKEMSTESFLNNKSQFETLTTQFLNTKNKDDIKTELLKDKGFLTILEIKNFITEVLYPSYFASSLQYEKMKEQYMKMVLDFYKDSVLAPDANSTVRIAFGNVKGYTLKDGTTYSAMTNVTQIPLKLQTKNPEYKRDDILLSLISAKQFGTYSKDTLYVDFVATNQTTGGNSGSPVLNAYGNFVGLNFDRNWQGTVGDLYFDESVCRNISVDVRYILFCIEMYGKATNIMNELTFVNKK